MKYPHTPYFTFSPSVDRDDIRETGYFDLNNFINKDIIFTIKMDGSNCQMTNKHLAARNGMDANHLSFDLAKRYHSEIKDKINENYIIFGEWLYAKHSIQYNNLDSYFQIFAVYDGEKWLGWKDIIQISKDLGFLTVRYSSIYNLNNIKDLENVIIEFGESIITKGDEGIVVRNVGEFINFKENVAKFVRANHVQTDEHWSKKKIVKNKLRGDSL
jgi:hypothetical protein